MKRPLYALAAILFFFAIPSTHYSTVYRKPVIDGVPMPVKLETIEALQEPVLLDIEPAELIAASEPILQNKAVSATNSHINQPTGSCYEELVKYGWNHTVAYNVMMAESGGDPSIVGDDWDDYSVGCFQINLLGVQNMNAKYRDSVSLGYAGAFDRSQLKDWLSVPANNVAVAAKMWSDSGWQPWSFSTCKKVACY